jgi:subtilase family serine protease
MFRKILKVAALSILATIALGTCTIDLVPVGRPDLSGPPSFCRMVQEGPDKGKLIVTVKNQGTAAAPASTATVEFYPGGPFQLQTPAIPAGGSVDLEPLSIPAACFNPDCEFKITVDSGSQVKESNEGNNTVSCRCIG